MPPHCVEAPADEAAAQGEPGGRRSRLRRPGMEPRSWLAPGLLVAGLLALLEVATFDLVLAVSPATGGSDALGVLRTISLVAAGLLLAFGLLVGWVRGTPSRGETLRWYSVLLGIFGLLALGMA